MEDVLEKRKPHREQHIALANSYANTGKLKLGGALSNIGTDPSSALIVFTTEEDAREFVSKDPYVQKGIVTAHSFQEWHVVIDGTNA